jgi:hypothetical protein
MTVYDINRKEEMTSLVVSFRHSASERAEECVEEQFL